MRLTLNSEKIIITAGNSTWVTEVLAGPELCIRECTLHKTLSSAKKLAGGMWGTRLTASWPLECLLVKHQRWISGNLHYVVLSNANKAAHSDFEAPVLDFW